jgi:hypothetical protein
MKHLDDIHFQSQVALYIWKTIPMAVVALENVLQTYDFN